MAIDCVCQDLRDEGQRQWRLRRATLQDFKGSAVAVDETLLYGVVAFPDGGGDAKSNVLATFYFAYSTWDGRFLYLDCLGCGHDSSDDRLVGLSLLLHHALAEIAVRLDCDRFTWQHSSPSLQYPGNVKPEFLHGCLTLHWGAQSIREYLGLQDADVQFEQEKCGRPLDYTALRALINRCLEQHSNARLGLKLATVDDVNEIARLVQGLADHVNEPDAVNTTVDHYRRDGFEGRPCFHCIVLNHIGDDGTVYTCGIAFCYLGFSLSDGLFLYLEDLFIEEAFRGKGAGTVVMRALASICYSLGCSRFVWQALVSVYRCLEQPSAFTNISPTKCCFRRTFSCTADRTGTLQA